jgi:6-pyruvoyltetrahydropterin/6-carboxytetrahydropterin synthase
MKRRGAAMQVKLTKSFDFEAAHWLPTFPEGHKCRRLHGHSFKVDVIVAGEVDPAKGYLIDFGVIKDAVEPVRRQLDHYCLNDIAGLENPTAEMLARWVYDRLKPVLPLLHAVRVRETCTCEAEYGG